MKRKRFSVEQITSILQQVAGGMAVGDVCRQVGISEQTQVAGIVRVMFFDGPGNPYLRPHVFRQEPSR